MEGTVSLLKSICIAFSMFSKLPVPQFEWKEKDMRYMILFFPLVGIVIGAIIYLWGMICNLLSINTFCFALIGMAIPIFISGGIHIDGYMDTMDALHSYQNKEKKLEILKDPHIGAFSVIQLLLYLLLVLGAYSEIEGKSAVLLLGTGFWLSRILSAIGIVSFPCAKMEGLGYLFSGGADKGKVRLLLSVQLLACGIVLLSLSPRVGGAVLIVSILALFCYWRKCNKEFGGFTGDTSGYFTVLCEGAIIVAIAAGCVIHWV